ncbi:hypothetical protein [Actinokineospora sp. NBRC 105648]|uniref:hypothetical protein n=1 Tax=Actinokineospora sp. NBRC 105648 TaxID=3032206 RepID=UPI0024A20E73|nr:hypothetical protein [Actinokineospora sp. NBRC 105648]GLZ40618.1 hypothetical protein Acsp05_42420 [Actinokineospora sp. NBRC 105648]
MVPTGGMGPFPMGDPAAIAEVATTLRRVAAVLGGPVPGLGGWQSEAACRARDGLSAADRAVQGVADSLRECASAVDGAARELAVDQRVWRAQAAERAQGVAG